MLAPLPSTVPEKDLTAGAPSPASPMDDAPAVARLLETARALHETADLAALALHGGVALGYARRADCAARAEHVSQRNTELLADLERRAARLAALSRVQQAIPRARRREVYAEIAYAIASVVDVSAVALLEADPASGDFIPLHLSLHGAARAAATLPASIPAEALPLVARARAERRPVHDAVACCWWRHPGDDAAPVASSATSSGTSSDAPCTELAAPILYGDRVLGVLQLQGARGNAFDADDVEFVAMIGRQVGAALELAHRLEAQQHQRDWAVAGSEIARAALGDQSAADAALDMLRVIERVAPVEGAALALVSAPRGVLPDDPLASDAAPDGAADGAPDATVMQVAELPDTVEWLAATGGAALLAGRTVPMARSVAAGLTTAGAVDVADAAEELELVAPGLVALAMRIVAHDRMVGVLLVTVTPDDDGAAARDALARLAPPIALALDALARDRDEARRRAHERTLATALGTLADPVLLLDGAGHVHHANDAALQVYGYTRAELAGLPFDRLVLEAPAPGQTLHATSVARHLLPDRREPDASHGVLHEHQEHRRRDGSTFPVMLTRAPVVDERGRDGGRAAGEVVLVRDLTGERRLEAHLRQHDKLAALGELIAGVAHELNNPLTGISALSQLLLEDPLEEEQLESVRLVKREADRAAAIIRDLLLFARRTGSHFTALDLNALVHTTVRLRAYHLRSDGIRLELELADPLPYIHADEQKLQQVLLHLLGNAEDALEDAAERVIRVRTRAGQDRVILEVSDTGRGMTAEAREHAFEPFFTTKRAGAGTGLGLSVSYGIVEAHGGLLSVDSTPGRGTTFRVLLPRPADTPSSNTEP